jgi:hypothetical protein
MNKKIIGILIGMLFILPLSTVIADDDERNGSNRAPCAPIIVEDSSGDDRLECECTFYSTDPDGDEVFYYIDWGDSEIELIQPLDDDIIVRPWDGPYDSGELLSLSHKYSERGNYVISIKAKDNYDLESPTTTMPIKISYFNAFNSEKFDILLEKIQNLFPILRDIINL